MRKVILLLMLMHLFIFAGCDPLPEEVRFGINLTAQTSEQAVIDAKNAIDETIELIKVPYYKELAQHRNVILKIMKENVTPDNFEERLNGFNIEYAKAKKKIDDELEEVRQKLYAATINLQATNKLNRAISEYINREGKFNIETALDLGKQMLDIYKEVKK